MMIDFDTITLEELKVVLGEQTPLCERPKSDDFCGVYFHGRSTPFTLLEHEVPIRSFRYNSEYNFPIFLFCNVSAGGELDALLEKYDNIHLIPIKPMHSMRDYNDFVIFEMWKHIPINNTLTFHSDGWLINPGWERFITHHDFDYIGAPWCYPTGLAAPVFRDANQTKYQIKHRSVVGNGGFCFRKKDKCQEVVAAIDPQDLCWEYLDGFFPDDVFFSYFGFGLGIFKRYDLELAYKWSAEPIASLKTFGFHKTFVQMKAEVELKARKSSAQLDATSN